jgi:Transposase DDE domain group 1
LKRSFSSFRHRAHPWSHQRRICYKAEDAVAGSNLRFLATNLSGRSCSVFSFYNDRGECENRVEEFKNGFAADRLSRHRFRANAFRLLLHSFAYNLFSLFRLSCRSGCRPAWTCFSRIAHHQLRDVRL